MLLENAFRPPSHLSPHLPFPPPGEQKGKSNWDKNGVFDIVDIYNPMTNSWRFGEPMPVAMHGLYPVLYQDKIVLAGGSPKLGPSTTDVVQIYEPVP